MEYAAYCRVSTEEQAKGENYKLRCIICRILLRNGISISDEHWYMDDGFSGAERMRIVEEVAFFWMSWRKDCHVLVWKVDRLARDDFVAKIYRILKAGVVDFYHRTF